MSMTTTTQRSITTTRQRTRTIAMCIIFVGSFCIDVAAVCIIVDFAVWIIDVSVVCIGYKWAWQRRGKRQWQLPCLSDLLFLFASMLLPLASLLCLWFESLMSLLFVCFCCCLCGPCLHVLIMFHSAHRKYISKLNVCKMNIMNVNICQIRKGFQQILCNSIKNVYPA